MNNKILTILAIVLVLLLSGCFRGSTSEKPPIHVNPNMDHQPKYKAQAQSNYFEDGAAMRQPIAGTVARGELHDDVAFYQGKDKTGTFIQKLPVPVTTHLLERGRKRFEIYCAPCHSPKGDGQGIIVQKGFMPPPDFHQDKFRHYPDGQVFDVISNGFRNMPSYKHQIPVADRWAIVAHVRELQRGR